MSWWRRSPGRPAGTTPGCLFGNQRAVRPAGGGPAPPCRELRPRRSMQRSHAGADTSSSLSRGQMSHVVQVLHQQRDHLLRQRLECYRSTPPFIPSSASLISLSLFSSLPPSPSVTHIFLVLPACPPHPTNLRFSGPGATERWAYLLLRPLFHPSIGAKATRRFRNLSDPLVWILGPKRVGNEKLQIRGWLTSCLWSTWKWTRVQGSGPGTMSSPGPEFLGVNWVWSPLTD